MFLASHYSKLILHSLCKYLVSIYYVSGFVLGARPTVVNTTDTDTTSNNLESSRQELACVVRWDEAGQNIKHRTGAPGKGVDCRENTQDNSHAVLSETWGHVWHLIT